MKICLINNLYPPYARGGAEQVVRRTVEGLLQAGHQVVLITTSPKGEETQQDGKLKIYRFKPWNLFFYTNAHKHSFFLRLAWHFIDTFHTGSADYIKDILEKEQPDVVHTHNLMGVGFLIPRVIRKLGIHHIHTVHDVQLVEPSGIILKQKERSWRYTGLPVKIYTSIMKRLMGSPNYVISPSQFLMDFYKSRGFFKKSISIILRNPITVEKQEQQTVASEKSCRFLYLGQIEKHKGVIPLIRAFIALPKETKEKTELHIVGDGSLFNKIKKLAANEPGIQIHGRVSREKLPEIFKQVDMTIVPSVCYENSPTVIFESFAFGKPVLASNIEGIAELIEEGENGLTFESGNDTSLQEKITWCAEHKEDVNTMSKKTTHSLEGLSQEEYIKKLDMYYIPDDQVYLL